MTTELTDAAGLTAQISAYAPADLQPPTLEETDVSYWVDDTAVGRMLFAVRADGRVVASRFAPDTTSEDDVLARVAAAVSPRVLRAAARTDDVRREVEEFLSGRRRVFDVVPDLSLARPFQRSVLETLAAAVPFGERTSYGHLAAATGRPGAARAVGTALGTNPLCVVVPCHRVVAASGALSGYAGGPEAKRLLLQLEDPGRRVS